MSTTGNLNMDGDKVSFDPSSLDDPIAIQTHWTPLKKPNLFSRIRTHKLVAVSSTRLEFRKSIEVKLVVLGVQLVGVGFIGFSMLSTGKLSFDMETFWQMDSPLFYGVVIACVGVGMLCLGNAPIVFDKSKGFFWKGRKAPDQVINKSNLKNFTEHEHIHALQLISKLCVERDSDGRTFSYHSYELNLVLKNGQRIYVVTYANYSLNFLRKDAATLSEFLGKPVWDAIN